MIQVIHASPAGPLTQTVNADGFSLAGGTTPRTLTVVAGNVQLNQSLRTTDSPTFAGVTIAGGPINFPTLYTNANFAQSAYDGTVSNDALRIGYNLSGTLYVPNLATEPQLYLGFESNYLNSGNLPTSELYLRYEGIGLSGATFGRTTGYVEPFFTHFDRATNYILNTHLRGEFIHFADTDDNTLMSLSSGLTGAEIFTQLTVGNGSGGVLTLGAAPTGNHHSVLQFMDSNATFNWQIASNLTVSGGLEFAKTTALGGSTFGNPSLVIDGNGKVGIGTTTPAAPLSVVGAQNATALELVTAYGFSSLKYSALRFTDSNFAGGNSEVRNYVDGSLSLGSDLVFYTSQAATGVLTERLRIGSNGNGNIGIGVPDPQAKLDVLGNVFVDNFFTNAANYERLALKWSGNIAIIGTEQAGTGAARKLQWQTGGRVAVTIDEGQKVGFGVIAPSEKIDVAGSIQISDNAIKARRADHSTGPVLLVAQADSAPIRKDATVIQSVDSNPIQLLPNFGFVNGLTVAATGQVGIGTNSPTIGGSGKLHMNADTFRLDTARTPASATAAGNPGEYCWDANFLYICIANARWRRVPHAAW